MAYLPRPATCEHCGEAFMARKPTGRFCSKRCSTTSRITPEWRERSRRSMHTIRSRPEVQKKLAAHLSSPSNPVRSPEAARKAQEALRAQGYPTLNGGNGHGPTRAQQTLADALGWPMEHVVPTRAKRSSGWPSHYKLDIANPTLQVAIEVDGFSHQTAKIRAADRRKDAWLTSRGWTVLRFSNQQVLTDLPSVLAAVESTTSRRVPATTSPVAS